MNAKTTATRYLNNQRMMAAAAWEANGARWTVNPHNADKLELVTTDGTVVLQVLAWGDVYDGGQLYNAPRRVRAAAPAAPQYRGDTVRHLNTGTTHYVNGWGESFCGRWHTTSPEVGAGFTDTATCKSCQRAGNAAKSHGFMYKAGSPASR